MKDFCRNIHQIYSKTPGEAWIKVCRLVMENGMQVHDGGLILKEIINLFVSIEIPSHEDKILIKWGNKDEKEWMRRLWLETKPIPAMGRFPSLQISYAQRLFDVRGKNHIDWVIGKLKSNPETKSATISTLFPGEKEKTQISCVTTLDFKIRDNKLTTTVFIRSQDAYKKFQWDVIFLGRIAQMIAEKVGVNLGALNSFIVSEHIYDSDFIEVKNFLNVVQKLNARR